MFILCVKLSTCPEKSEFIFIMKTNWPGLYRYIIGVLSESYETHENTAEKCKVIWQCCRLYIKVTTEMQMAKPCKAYTVLYIPPCSRVKTVHFTNSTLVHSLCFFLYEIGVISLKTSPINLSSGRTLSSLRYERDLYDAKSLKYFFLPSSHNNYVAGLFLHLLSN
jgi:hypothetical protein